VLCPRDRRVMATVLVTGTCRLGPSDARLPKVVGDARCGARCFDATIKRDGRAGAPPPPDDAR